MVNFDRLSGTYLNNLLEQPRAVRDTATGLTHLPELDGLIQHIRSGRFRRVVLTGMGGSYHLLHPLHLDLTAGGFPSIMAETSELIHYMTSLLSSDTVVIAVSQSGASAEIVRLVERQEPYLVGISNTPGSPLVQRSRLAILTRAGEEGGVACKTALTSLAALYWIAQHFRARDLVAARCVLDHAADACGSYLERWQAHVQWLKDSLKGVQRAFIVGRGPSLAAAGLGAMLQKEAAHFHAEGMSSAALRHGPFEMLGPDSFVLVFEGNSDVHRLHDSLVRDVVQTGARAALCGTSVADGPFALPVTEPALRPMLELLPAQMMSLTVSYLQGREPGRFERITKVTTLE